jgi:hypothetical protein
LLLSFRTTDVFLTRRRRAGAALRERDPSHHLDYKPRLRRQVSGEAEASEQLPQQQVINIATAAGAYVGSVREIETQIFVDESYEFFAANQGGRDLPFGPAQPCSPIRGNMTLPINKILRLSTKDREQHPLLRRPEINGR